MAIFIKGGRNRRIVYRLIFKSVKYFRLEMLCLLGKGEKMNVVDAIRFIAFITFKRITSQKRLVRILLQMARSALKDSA